MIMQVTMQYMFYYIYCNAILFTYFSRLKLKVENTIRWRINFDEEGNAIRESNSKLVRWSDGSMSLHLGSEIFDVYKQPLQVCSLVSSLKF